jgi:hypothetical protein
MAGSKSRLTWYEYHGQFTSRYDGRYDGPEGENAAAMQADQDLDQTVRDEFVQSQQLAIRAGVRQHLLNAADDFPLPIRAQRFGGDHIGIMGGPIADPDFPVFPDHELEIDRGPGGSMKESLPMVSRCPLWPRDVIFASCFGRPYLFRSVSSVRIPVR